MITKWFTSKGWDISLGLLTNDFPMISCGEWYLLILLRFNSSSHTSRAWSWVRHDQLILNILTSSSLGFMIITQFIMIKVGLPKVSLLEWVSHTQDQVLSWSIKYILSFIVSWMGMVMVVSIILSITP